MLSLSHPLPCLLSGLLHISYPPFSLQSLTFFPIFFLTTNPSSFFFLSLPISFSLSLIFPSCLLRLFCVQLQCYFSVLGFSPLWVLFSSPLVVRSRCEENIFFLILGSVLYHSMVWILAESRLNGKYFPEVFSEVSKVRLDILIYLDTY